MSVTFGELCECLLEDPDVKVPFLGILELLRSLVQGEPATLEGACASCIEYLERVGPPTHENLRNFIKECPGLWDLTLPDWFLKQQLFSYEAEKAGETG